VISWSADVISWSAGVGLFLFVKYFVEGVFEEIHVRIIII
jgi:hypothetical protein